jgi:putative lipase involved disintegration of autophagic bodies
MLTVLVQNGSYGYDDNGVRAQVFSNDKKSLYVIAIKGTSAGLWPGKHVPTKQSISFTVSDYHNQDRPIATTS